MLHYFFGNTGLAGIFIAAVVAGVLAIISDPKKIVLYKIGLTISGFVLLLLIYLQARAAFVGYIVALAYLYRLNETPWFRTVQAKVAVIIGGLMLLTFLVLAKRDSSKGRALVYSISWDLFQEHWLEGVGWGKFRVAYGLQQAKYFQTHSTTDREAMLADATLYAFNDCWQLLIELGVLKFALMSVGLLLVAKQTFTTQPQASRAMLNRGARAGLILICLASLFSYPFQMPAVQVLVSVFLAGLYSSLTRNDRWRGDILIIPLLALIVFSNTVFKAIYKSQADQLIEKAEEKWRSVSIVQSIHAYRSSYDLLPQLASGIPYARALLLTGHVNAAADVIASLKKIQSLPAVFILSAEVEEKRGALEKAENELLLAHYMVPNRLKPRCLLVKFYLRTRDTVNALGWAENLLLTPVKIHSTEADSYRQFCARLIKELAK